MTQTEKTLLPPGWQELTIVELSRRIRGGDDQVTEKLAVDNGSIGLIFSGDLKNSQELQISKKVTEDILQQTDNLRHKSIEEIRREVLVPPKSVLVALARSKAGAVGMHLEGNVVINHAIVAITPDPTIISPELLFYFFRNPRTRNRIKREFMPSGKSYASIEDIKTLRVNIPPLEQQDQMVRQIEALLREAERAQALLQENQKLMDQLLESALHEVFTEERKGTWNARKLGGLAAFQDGKTDLRQSQYERYPFIEADDIDATMAQIQINRSRAESTLPPWARGFILDKNPESLVYANTFISDTAWRSRVAMPYHKLDSPPDKLRCKDDLFALTAKNMHPRFLFWTLLDTKVTALMAGNTPFKGELRIKLDRLNMLEVRFPEIEEQERISAYFDTYQEQLGQMKKSHIASQQAIDQMEGSILDQVFREE